MNHVDYAKGWIKEEEGFRATPYRCPAGRLTIGYGWNMEGNPMTEDLADLVLTHHMFIVIAQLYQTFGENFSKLSDVRKAVMIDLCYWIGIGSLKGFRHMWRAIELNDYDLAANELLASKLPQDDLPFPDDPMPERVEVLADRLRKGFKS